jgi:hypothetical protein
LNMGCKIEGCKWHASVCTGISQRSFRTFIKVLRYSAIQME